MANVKEAPKGMRGGKMPSYEGMPDILRDDNMLPPRTPPNTIESQLAHAAGKAGMNWTHPQLAPEQHIIESEEGMPRDPKVHHREGDFGGEGGGPTEVLEPKTRSRGLPKGAKGGGAKRGGDRVRHRSTSGAPGHAITGQ